MTTLVTGFEPFGDSDINSSELVVTALDYLEVPEIVTAVLPTSYRRAEAHMGELLHAHRPDSVLMLGLAQSTPGIRFEQVALNLDDCDAPDNDGDVRERQKITEGAPVGYWSSFDLERMAAVARDMGEEVFFSHDAGGYVCNHGFFTTAHLIATEFPDTRCGFVHLPPVPVSDERLLRFVEIVRSWVEGQ